MLTIRLSRVGKKNKPMYRLVISEKARDPYGIALEILGSYNPHTKELQAKNERIKYWISKGSQMSPTVNNLLIDKGVIEGKKVKASGAGKKKKEADNKQANNKTEKPTSAKASEDKQESKDDEKKEKDPSTSSEQIKETTEDNKTEEKKDDAPQPAEEKKDAEKNENEPPKEEKTENIKK